MLLACAAAALVWANGPWAQTYFGLWETVITVGAERFVLSKESAKIGIVTASLISGICGCAVLARPPRAGAPQVI